MSMIDSFHLQQFAFQSQNMHTVLKVRMKLETNSSLWQEMPKILLFLLMKQFTPTLLFRKLSCFKMHCFEGSQYQVLGNLYRVWERVTLKVETVYKQLKLTNVLLSPALKPERHYQSYSFGSPHSVTCCCLNQVISLAQIQGMGKSVPHLDGRSYREFVAMFNTPHMFVYVCIDCIYLPHPISTPPHIFFEYMYMYEYISIFFKNKF